MELLDICVGDDGIIGHMFVLLLIIAMKINHTIAMKIKLSMLWNQKVMIIYGKWV